MVNFLNSWASGVVVSVIVGSILEMILPEGNNKKYVKIVIGVFILFTIISPVIMKFTGGIDLKSIVNFDEYEESVPTMSGNVINDSDIINVYRNNISNEIKNTLEQNGYKVKSIDIKVSNKEDNFGEIQEVNLTLKDDSSKIEKINIGLSGVEKKQEVSETVECQIKNLLSTTYGVPKESVYIN